MSSYCGPLTRLLSYCNSFVCFLHPYTLLLHIPHPSLSNISLPVTPVSFLVHPPTGIPHSLTQQSVNPTQRKSRFELQSRFSLFKNGKWKTAFLIFTFLRRLIVFNTIIKILKRNLLCDIRNCKKKMESLTCYVFNQQTKNSCSDTQIGLSDTVRLLAINSQYGMSCMKVTCMFHLHT